MKVFAAGYKATTIFVQLPDMVNYSMDGRTYRYFKGDPLYPFGYGLSYSFFFYSGLTVPASIKAGDPLRGQVLVSNVGEVDSDEVSHFSNI